MLPLSLWHSRVPGEDRVLVGATEAYEPRCRQCFEPRPVEVEHPRPHTDGVEPVSEGSENEQSSAAPPSTTEEDRPSLDGEQA